ncbi:hypothetical protein BBG47_21725 [Paenibacillus sp. KS1]|nr:hypothetical protein BBG47_21725 [Paenibacillus sp. KS1]
MTKTILIVEDEHILREIMKDYFSNEGYNVLEESVKVCIENTGVHIPSEKIEKIWDRFYRGEASRHRSTGGTGLGLPFPKKYWNCMRSVMVQAIQRTVFSSFST